MDILQFLLILKAHRKLMLVTLMLCVALVAVVSLVYPKTYSATASLVVNVNGADPVTGQVMQGELVSRYLTTQIDVIGSHSVALKVVDNLNLMHDAKYRDAFQGETGTTASFRDWLADELLRHLNVKPSNQSNVFYVTFKAEDPRRAAQFANSFVQAYIQTNLQLRTQPASRTATWYNTQLDVLRSNLEKNQAKLTRYRQSNEIVSLDEKLDVESTRLAELSSQLVAAQGQTVNSQSIQNHAGDASAGVVNNPVIQGLKEELAKSEAKLKQQSERVGKNHPDYQLAKAEVDSLRNKLAGEVHTVRQSIANDLSVSRQRESALHAAVAAQKAKVLKLNAERDVGTMLAGEVESAQRIYDQALERFNQTRMESHADQTAVSVLSPAVVPLTPSAPNLPLNMALSVILGTLLSIGLALIKEMLNPRVRSERDALTVLGVPVLGVMAADNKASLPLWRRFGLPAPRPV